VEKVAVNNKTDLLIDLRFGEEWAWDHGEKEGEKHGAPENKSLR